VIVSIEYFPDYSLEWIIHFEAIIRAFPNDVFGFSHFPSSNQGGPGFGWVVLSLHSRNVLLWDLSVWNFTFVWVGVLVSATNHRESETEKHVMYHIVENKYIK